MGSPRRSLRKKDFRDRNGSYESGGVTTLSRCSYTRDGSIMAWEVAIPDRVGSMKEGGEGMRLRMRLMRHRWKWDLMRRAVR